MKFYENKAQVIKMSHARCREFELDRNQVYSNKILTEEEFQEKCAENRELIMTANPFMMKLWNFVKGSSFFALLTDKEGCILNAIGDEEILSEAFEMKMIPGAFMDESSIGTNAMSMVLTEGRPIQISGGDHYVKAYHKWTCSAAPIKDIYGDIIGVIDLTGYMGSVHLHTLGMVVSASNAIEEMLKIKRNNEMIDYSDKHIREMFDSLEIGLIRSDINGEIITLNKKAKNLLAYKDKDLVTRNISDMVCSFQEIKKVLLEGKEFKDKNVCLQFDKSRLRFNLTAYSIFNSNRDGADIVFILREIEAKPSLEENKVKGKAFYTFDKIIGNSESLLKVIDYAKKISNTRSTILIMGESGTGKELFAQSIHNNSTRMNEKFVAVNCSAIPRELIESELFGYGEGAFTGAKKGGNQGKFQLANGGTIFLDEIGEMPYDMQSKILRVIEDGVIYRLGSSKPELVNVRIIAATNKDLKKEIEDGNFRKDLYYRLNVLPIYVPPLREREGDIPVLVEYFMQKLSEELNKRKVEISDSQMIKFLNYDWPGNVRELENMVELIINTETLPDKLFHTIKKPSVIIHDKDEELVKLEDMEKQHIIKVLSRHRGNITHSAAALGIGRNTLYTKMDKYNIKNC